MSTYRTKDGDTVDSIAWAYYGKQSGRVVEQVLEANPGLADEGPVLPAGLLIELPEVDEKQQDANTGVKLWD
jgi:phage tail protein X